MGPPSPPLSRLWVKVDFPKPLCGNRAGAFHLEKEGSHPLAKDAGL